MNRFVDPLTRLWRFADVILMRCPRCDQRATVVPAPAAATRWEAGLHRRLTCSACGYHQDWRAPRVGNGWRVPESSGPADPFFGQPLWLRTECCGGHVLWAYNADHLALLEDYLAATLRERGEYHGSMSLVERLPAWLKSAKHRDEALRGTRRLRKALA